MTELWDTLKPWLCLLALLLAPGIGALLGVIMLIKLSGMW